MAEPRAHRGGDGPSLKKNNTARSDINLHTRIRIAHARHAIATACGVACVSLSLAMAPRPSPPAGRGDHGLGAAQIASFEAEGFLLLPNRPRPPAAATRP
jgi:hypothetical protein